MICLGTACDFENIEVNIWSIISENKSTIIEKVKKHYVFKGPLMQMHNNENAYTVLILYGIQLICSRWIWKHLGQNMENL